MNRKLKAALLALAGNPATAQVTDPAGPLYGFDARAACRPAFRRTKRPPLSPGRA